MSTETPLWRLETQGIQRDTDATFEPDLLASMNVGHPVADR
jgi:hypothetical protein